MSTARPPESRSAGFGEPAAQGASAAEGQVRSGTIIVPDTTRGSVVHQLLRFDDRIWPRLGAYCLCALVPWTLMALAVKLGNQPWAQATRAVILPFGRDWNIFFTFFVSVPTLFLLLASDQWVLAQALDRVGRSRVISTSDVNAKQIALHWTERFFRVNLRAQYVGTAAALTASTGTWWAYRCLRAGFWASPNEGPVPAVAYVYIACIGALYLLIGIYVTRCMLLSRMLDDLVAKSEVSIIPMHPDGCGGLQSIGRLGLRNQYLLSILGLNIAVLAGVSYESFGREFLSLMVAPALVIYLVLGPLVFVAPMLPFRDRMREAKFTLMAEVAEGLRAEFERSRQKLARQVAPSKDDSESLQRLKEIGEVVRSLPVWPFDARTVRRFATAYFAPLMAPILSKLVSVLLSALGWSV